MSLLSSDIRTRVLDATPAALLAERGYHAAADEDGAAFITGYGRKAGMKGFPHAREGMGRGKYDLTLAGKDFGVGRGPQAFDMVTPAGLPVAVKGKLLGSRSTRRHADDMGLGRAYKALMVAVEAGLPAIVVEVRGEVAIPSEVAEKGRGEVGIPESLSFSVYDVAPVLRETPLVVKAGRGPKGIAWLRPDPRGHLDYTRLRVQLDEVAPIAVDLDLDGLDAVLRGLSDLVTWRRHDRHAIAQWAGVRLFRSGVVRVDGRKVCQLRAKEAAALAAILKGKGEPVKVACRTTASTLRKALKAGGVTLASTYGKGLTVARG